MRDYELELTVAPGDIDGLGHANNIAYVRWIQEVAVAHSAAVGLDWPAYQALKGCFVVRRHEIDYLQALAEGDRLRVRTWVTDLKAVSCRRHTEIFLADSRRLAARGSTHWVYVSLPEGRPVRIPTEVIAAFADPSPASSTA